MLDTYQRKTKACCLLWPRPDRNPNLGAMRVARAPLYWLTWVWPLSRRDFLALSRQILASYWQRWTSFPWCPCVADRHQTLYFHRPALPLGPLAPQEFPKAASWKSPAKQCSNLTWPSWQICSVWSHQRSRTFHFLWSLGSTPWSRAASNPSDYARP